MDSHKLADKGCHKLSVINGGHNMTNGGHLMTNGGHFHTSKNGTLGK